MLPTNTSFVSQVSNDNTVFWVNLEWQHLQMKSDNISFT